MTTTSAGVPADVVSLADHEAWARQHVAPATWAYVQGGAANEHTLAANTAAWQHLRRAWPVAAHRERLAP